MKKLEDIPKKQIFNVPDGYFEGLPGMVQSRVAQEHTRKESSPAFAYAWRYALGLTVIAVAALFWFQKPSAQESPESLLASVETVDLVAYLDDADFTTEELMDDVILHAEDADGIEDEVYGLGLDEKNFEEIMDEVD